MDRLLTCFKALTLSEDVVRSGLHTGGDDVGLMSESKVAVRDVVSEPAWYGANVVRKRQGYVAVEAFSAEFRAILDKPLSQRLYTERSEYIIPSAAELDTFSNSDT